MQPAENSLQSSLTLPPATLLKKSLNPDLNLLKKSPISDPTSSPSPPLPTAYIPALSTFAPPPPSSKSVFSPPPKQPTTMASTLSTPTSTLSTNRPSSSPGGIRTEDSGDWQPQPRRPRGPRKQHFNGTPKTFIKSSLRNHPGSIF